MSRSLMDNPLLILIFLLLVPTVIVATIVTLSVRRNGRRGESSSGAGRAAP